VTFTKDERYVMTRSLADRVDRCDEHLDRLLRRPMHHHPDQVGSISYWVRELLMARRTLVRAREAFWACAQRRTR